MRSAAVGFRVVVAVAVGSLSTTARAADPDPAAALFAGAGTSLAGFVTGGALLGTSHGGPSRSMAGWVTIETGFVLAPLVAHGAVGEWGRGAVLSVAPAGSLAATAAIFAGEPGAVEHGSLPQQRWMWGLFGLSLLTAAAGVVDAMFAPVRTTHWIVSPSVGVGELGVRVGGAL